MIITSIFILEYGLVLLTGNILFILELIYLAQIKEYRADRILSQIREDGIIRLIARNFSKLPAVSLRNLIIFLIATFIMLTANFILSLTAPSIKIPLVFYLLSILLSPIIGFVATACGVLITEPFAQYKRGKLIEKAKEKAQASQSVFIGISGTYGKTTTKEYLFHILSQKYKVGKTDDNMNTDVGVAISILKNLKPDTEYFVTEVGAYKLGEVRRAAAIFAPRAAIMLPFGNQHIDLFGSHENLVTAESEILDLVPTDGKIYVNADIPELQYVLNHSRGVKVTYSITKKNADIFVDDIEATGEGSGARIHYDDKSFKISTRLLGKHVIQNLLPAIAAAIDFGMKRDEVAAAIATLNFIPGKLSLHEKNGALILNDTGNASFHGFMAAINTIRLLGRPNMFILSKGIIELGREKKESYKKILMQIKQDNIRLATTDKLFKQFDNNNNVTIVHNETEFNRFIVSKLDQNTAVLLEGKFTQKFLDVFT